MRMCGGDHTLFAKFVILKSKCGV